MLQIKLLGDFSAQIDGQPVPLSLLASRHLLVCLGLSSKGQLGREQTASTLWPDADPQKGKSNLRQAVFRLRRELGKFNHDHILQATRNVISLDLRFLEFDSEKLIENIRSGVQIPSHVEISELDDCLLAGIELENESLADWVRFVRADFRARVHSALRELLQSVKSEEARLEAAQCLLEFDATDEEACRFAMQRYFTAGESAKALRCYSGLWVALADEFDVEPSPQTQEIAVQIKVNPSVGDDEITNELVRPRELAVGDLVGVNTLKVYLFWFIAEDAPGFQTESHAYVDALRYEIEEMVVDYTANRIKSFAKGEYFLEFATGIQALRFAFAILRIQSQASFVGNIRSMVTQMSIVGYSGSAEGSIATASKLAALSSGCDVVVTSTVRDQVTASIDASVEDLGEITFPDQHDNIRSFRLREVSNQNDLSLNESLSRTVARIAIVPFDARAIIVEHDRLIGDVIADELIHLVSTAGNFEVISRQSTKAFCGRESGVSLAIAALDSDYVVGGVFSICGDDLELTVELSDGATGIVILSERHLVKSYRQSQERVEKCMEILGDLYAAIGKYTVKQLRANAPVALESHKLLSAAVNMMNRFGNRDFFLARKALDVVVSRSPHWAPAHAMLAEWRVMRAQQGWMVDRKREGALASDAAARALDCDPDCSAAHVADGVVALHFSNRIDTARLRYDEAIELNTSNSLAWFSRSVLSSFTGEGEPAICDAMRAIDLSPTDPLLFLYQNALANAYLANGEEVKALQWIDSSLLLNKLHLSSLRIRIVANWRVGNKAEAKDFVGELLLLYPDFSVEKYKEYAPVSESDLLSSNARILGLAGVPD